MANKQVSMKVYLDALPYIGFGVDHAHVWLISSTVHEDAVVHLKEGILRVVLRGKSVSVRFTVKGPRTYRRVLACSCALCERENKELAISG